VNFWLNVVLTLKQDSVCVLGTSTLNQGFKFNMTILCEYTADKKLILHTLIKIKEHYSKNYKTKGNGICSYFGEASAKYIKSKFEFWPKFSGVINFPVPSTKTNTPASSAFYNFHKWNIKTQYGRDRRELLDFLIEQVKKDIDNEQKHNL